MEDNIKFENRIKRIRTISAICLIISFLITCVIWAASFVGVSGNVIKFGRVDIDVGYYEGSNKKYFDQENKTLFDGIEPFTQSSIEEEFFIENKGNLDAWYSIYFDNIEGTYGYDLLVTILDKNTGQILVGGNEHPTQASNLIKDNDDWKKIDLIKPGETKDLIIKFEHYNSHMPTTTQFKFDLCVEAVQSKNNS